MNNLYQNYMMKKGGKWIQSAIKKPGSFTKQAKAAGMSVPAFRDKVLANKEEYSGTTVKRANLAKTLSGMRKGQGGMDFKNPMAADQMPMDMEMPTPTPNFDMPQIQPLDSTIQLLDPDMKQARQMLDVAEKDLSKQQEKDKVKQYQKMLNQKYGAGLSEDGAWGPKTQAAYEKFMVSKKKTGQDEYEEYMAKKRTQQQSNVPWTSASKSASNKIDFTKPAPTAAKKSSYGDYLNEINMNKAAAPKAAVAKTAQPSTTPPWSRTATAPSRSIDFTKPAPGRGSSYGDYLNSVNTAQSARKVAGPRPNPTSFNPLDYSKSKMKSGGVKLKNYLK
jgi:hypothetical protein